MYITDNFLILTNDADLIQLKEEAIRRCDHSLMDDTYHYYKGAFIRTYNLTTFPAYYKRSQDGHTWDKISAEYFKTLVLAQLDILTNKKRQLVGLFAFIQPTVGNTFNNDAISPDTMTNDKLFPADSLTASPSSANASTAIADFLVVTNDY